MSKPKKLYPEDRTLQSLMTIRWRLVELIATIDKEYDYITRCKEKRYKKK